MGLDELKAKFKEEKDERKRRKITEMMLGESRVMLRQVRGQTKCISGILSWPIKDLKKDM